MRRLLGPAVVAALMVAALMVAAGCAEATAPARRDPPAPSATGSPAPTRLSVPALVGQNAQTALDTLKRLGFTNVDVDAVDRHLVVLVARDWTVQTQTPPPGQLRRPGTKIVLGCVLVR